MAAASQVELPTEVTLTPAFKLKDLEPIAEGGFGVVYRATHVDWGVVAYKKLKAAAIDDSSGVAKDLIQEAQMCNLRHPNIVALMAVTFQPDNYGVLLEYMKHGNLEDFLFTEVELVRKLRIASDVTLGMDYLHTRSPPVVHGDLKVQNVLIGAAYIAKICDFGLTRWKQYSKSHTPSRTKRKTVTNIARENWENVDAGYTVKSDVYAFGILLWELLSEEKAFGEADEKQIASAVCDGRRPDISVVDEPHTVPRSVKKLIINCWSQHPPSRPSFADLKETFSRITSEIEIYNAVLKEKFRESLQTKLVAEVNADSLADFLYAEKVLTYDDMDTLRATKDRDGRREQCREFLTLLHNSANPEAFVLLRDALRDESPWIVDELDKLCAVDPDIAHLQIFRNIA